MSFTYLKDQTWHQVTREERYFCSHLYHFLIGRENEFVDWLNNKYDLNLKSQTEWEVGFEVCFYRDFYKKIRNETAPEYLRKRTFDLCLFSESHILIIEAKVQQGFESGQLGFLKEDVQRVKELLGNKVEVIPILLSSKQHLDNLEKFGDFEKVINFNKITWVDLYEKFNQDIFMDAERKYNH